MPLTMQHNDDHTQKALVVGFAIAANFDEYFITIMPNKDGNGVAWVYDTKNLTQHRNFHIDELKGGATFISENISSDLESNFAVMPMPKWHWTNK